MIHSHFHCGLNGAFKLRKRDCIASHQLQEPCAESTGWRCAALAIAQFQMDVGVDESGQQHDISQLLANALWIRLAKVFGSSDGEDSAVLKSDGPFAKQRRIHRGNPGGFKQLWYFVFDVWHLTPGDSHRTIFRHFFQQ